MGYEGAHPIPIHSGGLGVNTVTGLITNNGGESVTGNSLTQYNALSVGANTTVNNIAPSATTGYGLCSNGASSQASYQNIPGTSMVFLYTVTVGAAVASIPFTSLLSSTYSLYCLQFYNLKLVSNNRTIALELSADNGSTWITTDYLSMNLRNQYTSTTMSAGIATARMLMMPPVVSNAAFNSGTVWMYNMVSANIPVIIGQHSQVVGSFSSRSTASNINTGINAFQVIGNLTNIAAGTFNLYGMKNS